MINELRFKLRKNYQKFKNTDLYLYLKKTELRKIYLLIQKIPHYMNVVSGKKVILHNDRVFKEMFKFIGNKLKISSVMETGTYLGHTTEFLAKNFPGKPIFTCEIIESNYRRAKRNLINYKNVKVIKADSIKLLNTLDLSLFGERPLFFLDAHGEGDCPLEKEISFIGKNFKTAIMIIDDFKIDNPLFQYDKYEGKEVSVERVIPNKNKKLKYNLLFPNYDEKSGFKDAYGSLTGYAIIFQGMESEFREIIKHPFIKKFFIDKSELLK